MPAHPAIIPDEKPINSPTGGGASPPRPGGGALSTPVVTILLCITYCVNLCFVYFCILLHSSIALKTYHFIVFNINMLCCAKVMLLLGIIMFADLTCQF